MNAADVMRAALQEGGHPKLADFVGRERVTIIIPIGYSITYDEGVAIQRARRIAYQATGRDADDLLSEDGYARICMEERP